MSLLEVSGLNSYYGDSHILFDVALRVVGKVTVMHNGAIFKHGTPSEIQADPDIQRIYLGGRHG